MEEYKEELKFLGNDEECTLLINDTSTKIYSSSGEHTKGSSKLTLKNFVNFNWNHCYYRGQLIAMHISEKLVAYGFNKPEPSEGLVRVIKKETGERCLIKGLHSLIEDISFAHIYEIIILACIDQSGTVNIYAIKEGPQIFDAVLIFQIKGDPSYCNKNKHLLSWCQFIPEEVHCLKEQEFNPMYKGKILAVVRGSDVEIWHIGMASSITMGPVYSNFNLNKSTDKQFLNQIKNSVIKISLIESEIVSTSFSPDGTIISVALNNGSVYFYKIKFEHNISECPIRVFYWHPKEVFLSLRSMAFLENRKHINGDVELWKYVVTFSNHNELVLWSCETWSCIQKLLFIRPYDTKNQMKLTVDGTGKYIFLNDIDNNLLYVMEVCVDIKSPTKSIKIISVTEILLQSPILNMIITDSKITHNDVKITEDYNSDLTSNSLNKCTTIINLYAIQPKSLQVGQLIITSPEFSIKEQLIESNKIKPTNTFPKPTFVGLLNSLPLAQDDLNVIEEIVAPKEKHQTLQDLSQKEAYNFAPVKDVAQKHEDSYELTPMEVHNLVKEKLKLKGINLNQKSAPSNNTDILNISKKKMLNYTQQPAVSSNKYIPHGIINKPQNNYNTEQVAVKPSNDYNIQQTSIKSPNNYNTQQTSVKPSNDYNIQQTSTKSPNNYNTQQTSVKPSNDYNIQQTSIKSPNNYNTQPTSVKTQNNYNTQHTAVKPSNNYNAQAQQTTVKPPNNYNAQIQQTTVKPPNNYNAQAQQTTVKALNNYNVQAQQIPVKSPNNYTQKIAVQSSKNYSYSKNTYDDNKDRECSPSNNEIQHILEQRPNQDLQFNYEHLESHNNFDSTNHFESFEVETTEPVCCSIEAMFNESLISAIEPMDKNETNNAIMSQFNDINACLQDINSQLKFIVKKQKKTDNQIASSLLMNTTDFCQNIEPVLINMVQNAVDQSQRKLQASIDHQLNSSHAKITDIILNSNANKVDTELFTGTLVASLSPTLDTILKDLFMSTVIPKFEQACCSMFKQIDSSFTERSLEYQNELKLLLNEEGNINYKLEYAFDKFKNDMSNIIKRTEKKILSAQNDMQKQFTSLIKEKSLSHVESYVKDSENIANQFLILSDALERGEISLAFEKALSASNLELVLYVCEKILPDELFQSPNPLKTPIVLSLIQQLSIDLTINTELKYRYLETAVENLDYTNDMHKDNIKLVLIKMDMSMEKFIQQYPINKYSRKFKMLQLAVKTIINYNASVL